MTLLVEGVKNESKRNWPLGKRGPGTDVSPPFVSYFLKVATAERPEKGVGQTPAKPIVPGVQRATCFAMNRLGKVKEEGRSEYPVKKRSCPRKLKTMK